jgi:quercetin 2,3-dioxygenase
MLIRLIAALLLLISSTTSEVNSFQTTTTTATATATSNSETCPSESLQMTKLRSVQKILPRTSPHWVGDGFHVYPVFHNLAFTKEVSPFLMFDYGAPKTHPARPGAKPLGVGQHPHRGFETVTIAFQGEVEHHDNAGNTGVIKAGDVQWMTAGRGIVHQEYLSKDFTNSGGTFEMCQLWVNLPKKDKMTPPAYQEIHGSDIPVVNLPLGATGDDQVLGTARVIAGSLGATQGAATTFSPVQVWDVVLPPQAVGSEIDLPIPSHHQCLIFVRRGSVQVVSAHDKTDTDPILKPQEVAILQMNEGDTVRVRVLDPDSSILILGGEPIDEPIAARGPFVMNTAQELTQAMMDYQSGNF